MAQLPGSYARLAGLQSEVNKVTVTRVAGGEVQYQRTMDTYRRALRYEVEHIGRQQKELKRSMRRYNRTLHQGRKERRLRQARLQEEEQRLRLHARTFKEAEESVKRQVLKVPQQQPPQFDKSAVSMDDEQALKVPQQHPSQLDKSAAQMGEEQVQQPSQHSQHLGNSPPHGQVLKVPPHPQRSHHLDKSASHGLNEGQVMSDAAAAAVPSSDGDAQHPHPTSSLSRSPVKGTGGEVGRGESSASASDGPGLQHTVSTEGGSTLHSVRIIHASAKGRKPYSKSRKEPPGKQRGEERMDKHGDDPHYTTDGAGDDSILPVIKEGGEEGGWGDRKRTTKWSQWGNDNKTPSQTDEHTSVNNNPSEGCSDVHSTSKPKPTNAASLDTRQFSQPAHSKTSDHSTTFTPAPGDSLGTGGSGMGQGGHSKITFASVATAVMSSRKKAKRDTGGVSMGDLVKLQHIHTSNTKQLFRMVDRLASRHAIPDLPLLQTPKPPSKDPRDNARIKERGDKPQSLLSSGMAKQGEVLYAMKRGYHVQNETDEDAKVPRTLPGVEVTIDRFNTDISSGADVSDGGDPWPSDHTSRLTVRRGSLDPRSPLNVLHENSPVHDDVVPEAFTPSLDRLRRRRVSHHSHHATKQPMMSMLELSEHATRARERSVHAPSDWPGVADSSSSVVQADSSARSSRRASYSTSPLPPTAPPVVRSRRDSVASQLQQRLSTDSSSQGSKNVWQSAFSRLKVLHTLQDLSGHFTKDT